MVTLLLTDGFSFSLTQDLYEVRFYQQLALLLFQKQRILLLKN